MANHGLPYMGSKNQIAHIIVDFLPKAENLYDLFCGGCAITHCALLSNKWSNVYANDIDAQMPQFFLDAINGKYKDEKRWISREDFFKLKDTDPFVRCCWSFGNRGGTYLYGEDVEPLKKAMHYAICFDDYSLLKKKGVNIAPIKGGSINQKRLLLTKKIVRFNDSININTQHLQACKRVQNLGRLKQVNQLKGFNLSNFEISGKSYDEIVIKPNSIIYCDIPYEDTCEYVNKFENKRFYDWACKQNELVIISSYEVKDDRFQRVFNLHKMSILLKI